MSQLYSGLPLVVVMMVKLLRLSFVVYGGRVQGGCHMFALDMMVITFALNTFTMSLCRVKVLLSLILCHNKYCWSDFTISFALLSYSTGLEASYASSYVRVVLLVSPA